MGLLRNVLLSAAIVIALVATTGAEQAQFWTAAKLRGNVEQQINGKWVPLKRGDAIQDGQFVRTSNNGVVEFQRGKETFSLSPSTVVQVLDKLGKQYTTVKATSGQVTVVADVRDVKHFEVDTPFLAAVVKGTIFTVKTGKRGSSVSVDRGRVAVEDAHSHQSVIVAKGQAVSSSGAGLTVTGTASETTGDENLSSVGKITNESGDGNGGSGDGNGGSGDGNGDSGDGNGDSGNGGSGKCNGNGNKNC